MSEISLSTNPDGPIWVDVHALMGTSPEDPPADGELSEVLSLYRGELLPGFYDEWTDFERRQIRSHFQRLIQVLLDRLLGRQRWHEAEKWGERWISLGDVPEPAYRAVMVAKAGSGDRSGAVATYQRAAADLERELGLEPSPLLRSAFDDLTRPIPGHALPRDRLKDVTGRLRGELRHATILQVELVGVATPNAPADLESVKELLDESVGILVDHVLAYEGTVVRVENDGLLACFGAPIAHENDTGRALMAALDIAERFRASRHRDLSVRAGIETGQILVGELGWDLRLGYSAVGRAVDVAGSLRSHAEKGEILVGEAAERDTAGLFDYGPAQNIDLEGGVQTRAYALLGVASSLPPVIADVPESSFVGREEELATLLNLTNSAKSGGVAFVIGESGIGKTRLLEEARRLSRDIAWAHGYSQSLGGNELHHALGEPILGLVTAGGQPHSRAFDDLFARYPKGRRDRYKSAIGAIVATENARPSSHDIEPADLAEAVRALLRELGRGRPCVLAIEDLHWLDSPTIALIREVMNQPDALPLLMILSMRPMRETPAWIMLEDMVATYPSSVREIHLERLTDSAMKDLADSRGALPDNVKELLIRRSEGNPFFFGELHQALVDEGVLARRDGEWAMERDVVEADVPWTVQKVILARTDRLPDVERWVLQAASVIGMRFAESILREVADVELRQPLETLAKGDFIRLTSLRPEPTYVFRHALIRDALYSTLLNADRRRLHLRVGEALESSESGHAEDHAEILVYHYLLAGHPLRAQPFSAAMAENAWRPMALQESVRSLEIALKQNPPPELALRLALSLARARFNGADIPGSVDAYEDATKLAQQVNDSSTKAEAMVYAAMARWQGTEPQESRWPYLQSVIREVADDPMTRGKLLLLQEVARQYLAAGDLDVAKTQLAEARRGLETWSGEGKSSLESNLLNTEGLLALRQGHFDTGQRLLLQALQLAEQSGSVVATSRSRTNLTTALVDVYGDFDEGLSFIEETRETVALPGLWAAFVEETVHLARIHWGEGDIDRGLAEIDLLESSLQGQPTWLSLTSAKAPLLAAVGESETALFAAREGWESRQRTGDELPTAHAGLSMGRVVGYAGQPEEAMPFLEMAASAAKGAPALRAEILAEWIHASLSSDRTREIANVVRLVEGTPDISSHASAWRRAGLARANGDSAGLLKSADYFDGIGQEYVARLCRFRAAETCEASEMASVRKSNNSWSSSRGLMLY